MKIGQLLNPGNLALLFAFLVPSINASTTADIGGTWKFDKAIDFDFPSRQVRPPSSQFLQVAGRKLFIPPSCIVDLQSKPYYAGGPFQSLLKEGAAESAIAKFLLDQFGLSLGPDVAYFEVDSHDRSRCNKIASSMLVQGDKLTGVFAGSNFFGYSRSAVNTVPSGELAPLLQGVQFSQLPFFPAGYAQLCPNLNPSKGGRLQNPDGCAPLYFPMVATKDPKSPLASLVASHHFAAGGARHATVDYDDPAAHQLHPVFFVLPPMGDVVVARVEDFESNGEAREVMSGVYLSVRDGKVVDQLNEGCSMDPKYVCSSDDGKARYMLQPSGKFKRLE